MEINAQDSEGRDGMEVATAQEDLGQDQAPSPGITSCFHTLAMGEAELSICSEQTRAEFSSITSCLQALEGHLECCVHR